MSASRPVEKKEIHALGLLSGGLDSVLALAVVRAQGIRVTALRFTLGFGFPEYHQALGEPDAGRWNPHPQVMLPSDVPVVKLDVVEEFRKVLVHPRHGYGSGVNPCIDCKIFMFRKAKACLEEQGAHFAFSGEVLGQRPMSQHRRALDEIEKESGLTGILLRPLSAKLLPPTVPEQRGWVDRERLYNISGRSRKEQLRLATEFGIRDFPQPAGGCFLTEKVFAERLQDLFAHKGRDALVSTDLELLKAGRHFRLSPVAKAVVGRRRGENEFLGRFREGRTFLRVVSHPGPTAILDGSVTPEEVEKAARIAARYSDGWKEGRVVVRWERNGEQGDLPVEPCQDDEIALLRIGKYRSE